MGLWSSFKKAVKKVWRGVKATVRSFVKLVVEILVRVINLIIVWLPIRKKIRIHVFILRDEAGIPLINDQISQTTLQDAIDYAISTFKNKFEIDIKSYGKPLIQILPKSAPVAALNVKCDSGAASNEWGEAGDYFAKNTAGWGWLRMNLKFPITIFIVRDIVGKLGCSLGPITDYVTVSLPGTKSLTTLAHELGHCCGLLHREDIKNLMYPNDGRGNDVTNWQKFVVRNSRHCTFW